MTVENIGSAWHFPPGGGNKLPQTCDIQLQFKKKRKKEIYIKLSQKPPKTKALSMLANFQGILNIKFNFRLLGFLFFSFLFFYKVNHIQGGTEWLNVQQLKKATANRKKMQKHTKCIYLTQFSESHTLLGGQKQAHLYHPYQQSKVFLS